MKKLRQKYKVEKDKTRKSGNERVKFFDMDRGWPKIQMLCP